MTRLRDLGISIGDFPTGTHNAITDVDGVRVGYTTLIEGEGDNAARTGATAVLPHADILSQHLFAGSTVFNGNGELTGLAWINESGMLTTPIVLTNTHSVGAAHEGIIRYANQNRDFEYWMLPVVGETFDGVLNNINGLYVRPKHVVEALNAASDGPIAEGNVGGGTGMICHGFKGGTGSSSRRIPNPQGGEWTVGALVQANYGSYDLFRIDGVPVGKQIDFSKIEGYKNPRQQMSSIIILLATDMPLLPIQCQRLARRATVGLARVGGTGHNGSGDIFMAWSTANQIPNGASDPLRSVQMVDHPQLNPLFDAAAEAVEEAILNAMVAATTMVGYKGRIVHALPHDQVRSIMGLA